MLARRKYSKKIPPPRTNVRPKEKWSSVARVPSLATNSHMPVHPGWDPEHPRLIRSLVRDEWMKDSMQRYTRTTTAFKFKHQELLAPSDTVPCCYLGHLANRKVFPLTSGRLKLPQLYGPSATSLRRMIGELPRPAEPSSEVKDGEGSSYEIGPLPVLSQDCGLLIAPDIGDQVHCTGSCLSINAENE